MIFLVIAGVLFVLLLIIGIAGEVDYARYRRRMRELLGRDVPWW